MKKKSTLIKSLVILLFSVLLVALFGVVPLPEYNTEVSSEISGSIFYMVEIESSNLIPPAPDILDQCIFKINISVEDMNEKKVIVDGKYLFINQALARKPNPAITLP